MTIKEIMKIASDEKLMFMLTSISESMKNDFHRTEREIVREEKARKIMAKRIKEELENA